MLPFFKKDKKEKIKKQGLDSTVSTEELLNETDNVDSSEEIVTELSIHPKMNVSTEQSYVLRFLNNELEPLKPNQISLSGIELNEENGKLVVSAFVRNSLSKGIQFQKVMLLLIGPDDEKIGRKEFDLSELGELPPHSSRPWNFVFEKEFLFTNEIKTTGWKLAFELRASNEHRLDLDESWEKSLPAEEKQKLINLVQKMDPPKSGEVNFLGLQANLSEASELRVTLLIRNGTDKNISIQQLPLAIEDATGEIIAQGGFKLNDLEIKANSSKPWTFIYPKNLLLKEEIDLSKWKATPINNN